MSEETTNELKELETAVNSEQETEDSSSEETIDSFTERALTRATKGEDGKYIFTEEDKKHQFYSAARNEARRRSTQSAYSKASRENAALRKLLKEHVALSDEQKAELAEALGEGDNEGLKKAKAIQDRIAKETEEVIAKKVNESVAQMEDDFGGFDRVKEATGIDFRDKKYADYVSPNLMNAWKNGEYSDSYFVRQVINILKGVASIKIPREATKFAGLSQSAGGSPSEEEKEGTSSLREMVNKQAI